jgi:hypothetical protein
VSGRAGAKARPAKPARARKGGRWASMGPAARRWVFIGGFSLALLVGLPLAHAMVGDIGAILLGTFAFGFVVGRMTLKR